MAPPPRSYRTDLDPSQILTTAVNNQFGQTATTDHFIASSFADGPLISRIAQSGALEMPIFTVNVISHWLGQLADSGS
jgi:hypothetical protein